MIAGPSSALDSALRSTKLTGNRKLNTTAFHPQSNGGNQRVNHAMAQMRSMVIDERQSDWDAHLPHIQFAYYSVSDGPRGE